MATPAAWVQALPVDVRPHPIRTAALVACLLPFLASGAQADGITLVSANASGSAANAPSSAIAMARDGTVLFESGASDLVPLPPRGGMQVYAWRDGTVRLVSRASDGGRANGTSRALAISANGRKVAFTSTAPDALGLGTNPGGHAQLFVADLLDDTVVLVSHALDAPTRGGNGPITQAMLSEDGAVVAFRGSPSDVSPRFVAGENVFASDGSEEPELVSINSAGFGGPSSSYLRSISADGRYVLFETSAGNMVQGVVDFNSRMDAFLRDRSARATRLVTHAVDNPARTSDFGTETVALSANGRFVLFHAFSAFLPGIISETVNVIRWDSATDEYLLVSHAQGEPGVSAYGVSWARAISSDGRVILFQSSATDLVPVIDDNVQYDLFVWREALAENRLVTRRTDGNAAWRGEQPSGVLSEDGNTIAFTSRAADQSWNVDDQNRTYDTFAYDVSTGDVRTLSVAQGQNRTGKAQSVPRAVLADGTVLIDSRAGDLVPADINNANDVFIHRRSVLLTDGFE